MPFSTLPNRNGTHSIKWDLREKVFGKSDVIPLWVADMDFETPDFIMTRIRERARHPVLGYTFRPDSLSKAFTAWVNRRYQWEIDPKWVSFSPGVVSAVSTAILAFTKPGDEVIVQPPVYFPFFKSVKGLDRTLVYNPLVREGGRLNMDFENLRSVKNPKTRMLILCNPHNPGGSAWEPDELTKLAEICAEHDIRILSDEIHSDLVFAPHLHTPLHMVAGGTAAKVITCMAASKSFNIAGLSSSLVVIGDESDRKLFEDWIQTLHIGMGNIFGAEAMTAAWEEGDQWLGDLMQYLAGNRKLLADFILQHLPMVKMVIPEATYLAWLDFRELNLSQPELINLLVEKAGVGLNSGTEFGPGGEGFMRLNFGCPASLLEEALIRIKNAINPDKQ